MQLIIMINKEFLGYSWHIFQLTISVIVFLHVSNFLPFGDQIAFEYFTSVENCKIIALPYASVENTLQLFYSKKNQNDA